MSYQSLCMGQCRCISKTASGASVPRPVIAANRDPRRPQLVCAAKSTEMLKPTKGAISGRALFLNRKLFLASTLLQHFKFFKLPTYVRTYMTVTQLSQHSSNSSPCIHAAIRHIDIPFARVQPPLHLSTTSRKVYPMTGL